MTKEEDFIHTIKSHIYATIQEAHTMTDAAIMAHIDTLIIRYSRNTDFTLNQKIGFSKLIFDDLRGLSVIQPLMDDPEVSEIMVNGYDQIYIEKHGALIKTSCAFRSLEALEDMIQKIVGQVNRTVNEASPICDARLENGARVNVVLPPIALLGPTLTIRKFLDHMYTMEQLVAMGSLDENLARTLKAFVREKRNIFICGGTGSGKTTLLNILSNCIGENERIITIEDSAELMLKHVDHWVRLEARETNAEKVGAITIRDLIKTALRMRPDRIIVGEVRGAETVDMFQAMNTGHAGSLSTGHANGILDMFVRLETMVLMHEEIPIKVIRQQMVSALDVMIHVGRCPDYSRKILEVALVKGLNQDQIQLESIYRYEI